MNLFLKLFLITVLINSYLFAQTNPFLSNNTSPNEDTTEESGIVNFEPSGPSTWPAIGLLISKSAYFQRKLQQSIAELMTNLKDSSSFKEFWILMGLSFIFGVLHAVGPGHRKAVLIAYFLGEGTKPLKGILTGFLLAIVHAASAIVLVGELYLFTTKSLLFSVNKTQQILIPITYGIIVLLGLWILFESLFQKNAKNSIAKNISVKGLVFSGIVPCPAASAIMILSVANNAVPIGIMSVISMSLGMGILLASVGLLTILFRNKMSTLLKNPKTGKKIELSLHLLSGFGMALFGLFMLIGLL